MRRRKSGLAIMAAAVAAAMTAVIITNPVSVQAVDAPACAVGYQVDQWSNGFVAQVKVTNNSAPIDGWTRSRPCRTA